MSKIRVTAAPDRRVPLPDGRVLTSGMVIDLDGSDALVFRLLQHGDIVPATDREAGSFTQPGPLPTSQEG